MKQKTFSLKTIFLNMDRSKKIGIGALAVLTAGALCLSAASWRQTQRELAEEAAAWEAELRKMAEEESLLIEPRLLNAIAYTGEGRPLTGTGYLPTKLAGVPQEIDLHAAIASLGAANLIREGEQISLVLPLDVPASVVIWRDPVGEDVPPESVNYTREETVAGVRCVFTASFGGYQQVDYEFDIKIDDYNQGKLGFLAQNSAETPAEEPTNG